MKGGLALAGVAGVAQLVGALSHAVKGCRFDEFPIRAHRQPGCRFDSQIPSQGAFGRQPSMFLSPSLPLSLSKRKLTVSHSTTCISGKDTAESDNLNSSTHSDIG